MHHPYQMRLLTNLLNIAAIIIIACFFVNCSPVPYANVGMNVPMIKNKGEVNLNGSYGITDDAEGIGLQAAAAVDSSWSIAASFYSMKSSPGDDWKGRGSYFDFGMGKFGSTQDGNFIYDGYLGVGFGSIKNEYQGSKLNVNFIKPYLQGSLGYSHQIVDVALTARFAVVNFRNEDFFFTDPVNQLEAANFFEENRSKFVFEPGITVRVGYRDLRLSMQFSTSTFKPKNENANANVNTDYFSIGLNGLISKRWAAQ
jgi:hypothetical protein